MFEEVETDYYIARDADQYLHSMVLIVGLHKPVGGIVGIAYSAGDMQLEACNITFTTRQA